MTSLWRHLWPNYYTLDFKILTQCVKMLGERVLQVWRWYLHRFRRYRKKTRGGGLEIAPPSGARVNTRPLVISFKMNALSVNFNRNRQFLLPFEKLYNIYCLGCKQISAVFLVGSAADHEFRRRLSAEGAKPESNNRWKSYLGHVGMWVAECVWYFIGIISQTKARSATNEVPKRRSQ